MIVITKKRMYQLSWPKMESRMAIAVVALIAVASIAFVWQIWGCALMALGFLGGAGIRTSFVTAPAGSAAKSSGSVQGLELVDSIVREIDVTAVDTKTAIVNVGASVEGNVQVPVGGEYLSLISVQTSWDMDNTATAGLASLASLHLTGNALRVGGTHNYLISAMSAGGKTAGGAAARSPVVNLPTKIPMVPSNNLKLEAQMLGEDSGTLTIAVALVFTKGPRAGGIEDGDFREGDLTAVDNWTSLTSIGSSSEGSIKVPAGFNNLAAVGLCVAVDVGADSTACVRSGVIARLTGNALASGGTYSFVNDGLSAQIVTTGLWYCPDDIDQQAVDIAVKPGNVMSLEATPIGEDPGSVTVGIQVFWGE